MTAQTENTEAKTAQAENTGNRPTHIVRKKMGSGKKADFETLGVAWDRGDGSCYVKLYGTQVVEGGFYVFPVKEDAESGQ
ncbi:MAG: hypothetical protein Q7U99_22055 [Rubrivivax sp.]|nr:hypothetical protein [Rubrivivax sp.]